MSDLSIGVKIGLLLGSLDAQRKMWEEAETQATGKPEKAYAARAWFQAIDSFIERLEDVVKDTA